MRTTCLLSWATAVLIAATASAGPSLDVGNYLLLGDTAGQTVPIWIAGDGNLAGLNLFVQVGNGGPELVNYGLAAGIDGPSIASISLQPAGGVFTGTGTQTNLPGIPQVASSIFDVSHGMVKANGLLLELTVDTTGLNSGAWPLMLKGVLPFAALGGPYDTAGVGAGGQAVPIAITNGTVAVPRMTTWNAPSGNWSDSSRWAIDEPNGSMRASITNGGTATVTQMGRACSLLTLGSSPGQTGTVSMTGGSLFTGIAYVGYTGTGVFAQADGNHVVQSLWIASESNSVGTYDLQGGNLVAGGLFVGGTSRKKGGTGTFTVSGGHAALGGDLTIWNGSAAHLSGGSLVGPDGNHPYVDVDNSGTLYVDSGVCTLGRVAGIGDTLTGTIVVGSGATLWAESIEQGSLVVEPGGTVHLAAENYDLFMSLARANQGQVPEPTCLALLSLGGIVLAGLRRRRAGGRGSYAR